MAPFVQDTFSGATAGSDLVAHTGEVGATWVGSANFKISSAARVYNTNDGTIVASGVAPDTRNYDIECDFVYLGGSAGYMEILANVDPANPGGTHYFAGWDAGFQGTPDWALGKNNGWLALAPGGFTLTQGQSYHLLWQIRQVDASNDSLTLFVDGVQQLTTTTGAIAASGRVGLFNIATGGTDTSGWHVDNFEAKPVAAAGGGATLTAPTVSLTSKTDTTVNLSATEATGGTSPYSYQWYRSTASGTLGTAITGATSRTLSDTGLTASTTYYYSIRVTDSAATPATADSAQFSVTTNPPVTRQIVVDGDSLSTENFSGAGTGYWKKIQALLGSEWKATSIGENGKVVATMVSQGAANVDSLYDPNLQTNICIAFGGVASLYFDVAPADIYSQIVQYCKDRRAKGWKVFVVSLPSGTYDGGLDDDDRKIYNSLLIPNWRYFADGLINLDADTRVGPLNAYLNNDHYVDTHHFSAKGNDVLANYAAAVISEFLTGGTPQRSGVFSLRL